MNKSAKRIIYISTVIAVILGVAIGVIAMYAAWDHNPQCEIHCDGDIHWGYWLAIGISWLIPVSIIVFFIIGIIPAGIVELWARLKKKQKPQ